MMGEARADGLCGDRGTEQFVLSHTLTCCPVAALPAAGGAQTPTKRRVLVGCRHFAPSALLQGGALDEMLVQSPAGGSGAGTASQQLLLGCHRWESRPALTRWCQSL